MDLSPLSAIQMAFFNAKRYDFESFKPKVAVMLGSGLDAVSSLMDADTKLVIPYTEIPGFPVPSVQGHAGQMAMGQMQGTPLIFLKGRIHYYEGKGMGGMVTMLDTIKQMGVERLLITNAAGGVNPAYKIGDLMAIKDHINNLGENPLEGLKNEKGDVHFLPQGNAWDKGELAKLFAAANKTGVDLYKGVYQANRGQAFETPAESKLAKIWGADAVGMSTVPENQIANHFGMKCAGISIIVNAAQSEDASEIAPSHDQTLVGAHKAEENLAKLVQEYVLS